MLWFRLGPLKPEGPTPPQNVQRVGLWDPVASRMCSPAHTGAPASKAVRTRWSPGLVPCPLSPSSCPGLSRETKEQTAEKPPVSATSPCLRRPALVAVGHLRVVPAQAETREVPSEPPPGTPRGLAPRPQAPPTCPPTGRERASRAGEPRGCPRGSGRTSEAVSEQCAGGEIKSQ